MEVESRRSHDLKRQLAWYVSALAYRWSNTAVSERADEDLFAYLGERLTGARIVDCGCGPGLLADKLNRREAGLVIAVDANPLMAQQAGARLSQAIAAGEAEVRKTFVDVEFFAGLNWAPDFIIFKRSLYASDSDTFETLAAAATALAKGGAVVVIHPESSLSRYAFGKPPRLHRFTLFHLLNRVISLIAVAFGISSYRTYTERTLIELLESVKGGDRVDTIASSQHAYNLTALVIEED